MNAVLHGITRSGFEKEQNEVICHFSLKNGGSHLWSLCGFLLTQATPGVFFVEINKRLPFTAVYKKQYSLPNWISLSKSFEEEGPLNVFHLRRENSKWHLRKKIPVCSNLLITLFKSKLLVFYLYWESIFIFVFSVVQTRKNAKKNNQKGEKEEEAEDPNFSPTDSEAETNASQTTSEEEEEEAIEETSNATSVLNDTKSSSKRLVQIYKYFIGISYGKSLHNLKK